MRTEATPGSVKRLRRTVAGFQQRTFRTPLEQLPGFVATLLAGPLPVTSASVVVCQVVFPPRHVEAVLSSHRLPPACQEGWSIVAEDADESKTLLAATFADWLDFFLLPVPKSYLLYADHDEYTTLFAAHRGTLSRMEWAMTAAGFAEVSDYVREL
jgi:hypothetical protein